MSLSDAPNPNCPEQPVNGAGQRRKNAAVDEVEESDDVGVAGESKAESAEEAAAAGGVGGGGHGLEISPGGLFHEAVADEDFRSMVRSRRHGPRRVDDGGGEEVLQGGVVHGLDRKQLEILVLRRPRRRGRRRRRRGV